MLIGLLIALGVDLIVVVAFAAFVFGRRRWLNRQLGEFAGAIQVSSGDIEGLSPKWKRGSGRWVRDVLVWSKAPLMVRNEVVPVDRLCREHPADAAGVKRLGDKPAVIEFASGSARIELAAKAEHHALVAGGVREREAMTGKVDGVAAQEDGPLPGVGGPSGTGPGAEGGSPGARPAATRRQRWLARLAFAAMLAAVVVLVVTGVLLSITALLLGLAGLAVACAAAWLFLARRGIVRWLALAVLVAAPVLVIVAYVVAGLLWEIALSAVLAAAALAAGRRGTGRAPRGRPGPGTSGSGATAAFRDHEPAVGRREGRKVRADRPGGRARRRGSPAGGSRTVDVAALARQAADRGADLLGVAGGDGTQALVAGIAAERDIPMMVISAGPATTLPSISGWTGTTRPTCLDALSDGVEVRIDLGLIGDRTFVNNASFGAYAEVVQSPAYRDDKAGTALQMLPDLLAGHQEAHLVVRAGGQVIADGPQAVLVSNNPYQTADIAGLGRRARLDQGVLGVVAVKIASAAQAAGLLHRASRSRSVTMLTAREVIIDADAPADPGRNRRRVRADAHAGPLHHPAAGAARAAPARPPGRPRARAATGLGPAARAGAHVRPDRGSRPSGTTGSTTVMMTSAWRLRRAGPSGSGLESAWP